jgi:23S rRNA A1618 N6-methylase RlmF
VDISPVSLSAAASLIRSNPQLHHLLVVRQSRCSSGSSNAHQAAAAAAVDDDDMGTVLPTAAAALDELVQQPPQQQQQQQQHMGPLLGAVLHDDVGHQERFHFCMCNPPFFESIDQANSNPHTACGGEFAGSSTAATDVWVWRGQGHPQLHLLGRAAAAAVAAAAAAVAAAAVAAVAAAAVAAAAVAAAVMQRSQHLPATALPSSASDVTPQKKTC